VALSAPKGKLTVLEALWYEFKHNTIISVSEYLGTGTK
jgi:hypothetical protein